MWLLFFILAATAFAAPTEHDMSDLIDEANEAKAEFESLAEDERKGVSIVLDVVGNDTLSDADKKHIISDMLKDANETEKKTVDELVDKTLKVNSYATDMAKKENPAVQAAIKKVTNHLMNMDFLMSSDENKKKLLNEDIAGLTDADITALKKIDQNIKEKEKELGLDKD